MASSSLRNPYDDPGSPPTPEQTYYQRVSEKRRKSEANRNQSLIHGFNLKPFATFFLESNDIGPLLNFIQTPNNSNKRILESFSSNYPNSFSLKLSRILSLNPPFGIRHKTAFLLEDTLLITEKNNIRRIRCDMFLELKHLILDPFKIELEERLFYPLTAAISDLASRIYEFSIGGWIELLEYIISCFFSLNSNDEDSVLNQRKGFMLLAGLPEDVSEHTEFWKNHYSALFENLAARMLDETSNEVLQALTYDALHTMLKIAQPLGEYEIGGSILLIILDCIDQHWNEETVLGRFEDLADYVSRDVDQVLNGKEGNVFRAMVQIAEKNGASKKLRIAAVEVLEGLNEDRIFIMETIINEISDVDVQRGFKVSLDMMFESDKKCIKFGKTLLNWLCLKRDENSVFRFLVEFLKTTYTDSKDLRKRHAVMIFIAGLVNVNISDDSVIATEIIRMVAEEINHIISIIIDSERAQEADPSEGGSEYLPDEEIIQSSKLLISSITGALKGQLSPYAEELFTTIAQLWGNDFPDRVKAIALSLFNIIGPHFPDKLQMYHDRYTCELLKTRDKCLHTQLEIARGIGICAKYGGQKFKTIANVAISKLYSLIEHEQSIKGEESRDGAMISDMAVSALGKICEFHHKNIDGPEEVIRTWLNFLPLRNDLSLAKNVHGQLCKMLKREDVVVLGPDNENLPKIISILSTILLQCDELATKETLSEINVFLDKHDGDQS
ncbi:PREDICTED: uncharacterized protein LOC109344550 [Lupinus angustifolius]|uniref:uncharacterized protein LOC109344550 n=1 Tax=Lupinus angustifolius TaxID=3871 RepID=UPI00092F8F06|nr:PREDICTED: uncharacterized protein LOC109344550 [Lupinus angustifolius]